MTLRKFLSKFFDALWFRDFLIVENQFSAGLGIVNFETSKNPKKLLHNSSLFWVSLRFYLRFYFPFEFYELWRGMKNRFWGQKTWEKNSEFFVAFFFFTNFLGKKNSQKNFFEFFLLRMKLPLKKKFNKKRNQPIKKFKYFWMIFSWPRKICKILKKKRKRSILSLDRWVGAFIDKKQSNLLCSFSSTKFPSS